MIQCHIDHVFNGSWRNLIEHNKVRFRKEVNFHNIKPIVLTFDKNSFVPQLFAQRLFFNAPTTTEAYEN